MPTSAILLDTSYLRQMGFGHPDFRRLLEFAKRGRIRVLVPHIVWEERRTQLLEDALLDVKRVRDAAEKLRHPWLGGIATETLLPLGIELPSDADIARRSKEVMTRFADENGIVVVPLGADHAERAWDRYFSASPPFNPAQKRENRRKDIPDAWICEAAIDLAKDHPEMIVLSDDDNLSATLTAMGLRVLRSTDAALEALSAEEGAATGPEADSQQSKETTDSLGNAIAKADAEFQDLQRRVLGYVGYLNGLSKSQLFEMMADKDHSVEKIRNAAERLALSGFIEDTGNHYIPKDKNASALAAPFVEAEIIKWLGRTDG